MIVVDPFLQVPALNITWNKESSGEADLVALVTRRKAFVDVPLDLTAFPHEVTAATEDALRDI